MVADVTRMGEWSPENQGGNWIDGATGPAVGARFRGHNRRRLARWSTTCEVVASEPGREFAFLVGGTAAPETLWRYRFEPVDRGTEVTESFELVRPISRFMRLMTRLAIGVKDREADMEQNMRATLDRLKTAAEAAEAEEAAEDGPSAGQ
jgi:hypothetical protein